MWMDLGPPPGPWTWGCAVVAAIWMAVVLVVRMLTPK
ncbi:hypothetical protein FB473_002568 [Brooklawnia cerclae]|uniref:ATP synthase F0 subunit 8 n=1 Tax=Brooklawnia cerclae TaxID=349934 RepID=A0ABX0SKR9_9ACTN|nr:hypothetical protein [Brooklawnia cerclae]